MGRGEDSWVCGGLFIGPGAALRLLELAEVEGRGGGGGGVPSITAGTVLLVGVCSGSTGPKLSSARRSNRLSFWDLAAPRSSSSSSCSSMAFAVRATSFRADSLVRLGPKDGREGGVDTRVSDEDCLARLGGGVGGSEGTGTRAIE